MTKTIKNADRNLPSAEKVTKEAVTKKTLLAEPHLEKPKPTLNADTRPAKAVKPKKLDTRGADEVGAPPAIAAKPAAKSADVATTAKPKTTKQEQVLTMLSEAGGATINEIMKTTGWQQHSVRGFFAGTVRKKLGFELTSEKPEGDERRYAIKVAA